MKIPNGIFILLVEVTRLELAASASRTQRSTKLSHTSLFCFATFLAATKIIISGICWNVNNYFLVLQSFFAFAFLMAGKDAALKDRQGYDMPYA